MTRWRTRAARVIREVGESARLWPVLAGFGWLAQRVDPEHYEHWAVAHPGLCSGGRCTVCGGVVCAGLGETEHCYDGAGGDRG